MLQNENDISAEKEAEKQGTRLQKKNVHKVGQKSFSEKKSKRQKVFNCVTQADYLQA